MSPLDSYMDHVADAASRASFNRHDEAGGNISVETLPENSSLLNFRAFAQDYPEKFFGLLSHLRPEFQELGIEYWVLEKPQHFIGRAHGFIQTRTWQALRIIEQTIGAFLLLGTAPDEFTLRPILAKAGLETTPFGSLTHIILLYAASQNYKLVAKTVHAPISTIRKIFRPAITALLASKDVYAVAVGAYLRSLTHQASLHGAGLSKSCRNRLRRVGHLRFNAPPADDSPLLSFGAVETLQDTPWCMLEISSTHRMEQLWPVFKTQGKRIFGKRAGQMFAPVNSKGELVFGYIFARSTAPTLMRALTRLRGISELSAIYNEEGAFVRAVTIPHADVQTMIDAHSPKNLEGLWWSIRVGQFVRVLTGPAAGYHGEVTEVRKTGVKVRVDFPTGRHFLVTADHTSVATVDALEYQKAFWGVKT